MTSRQLCLPMFVFWGSSFLKMSKKRKGLHYGTKPCRFELSNHTLSHELGSEWASEQAKWAGRSKGISERYERTNEWMSKWPTGPVLTYGFFAVLNHSALPWRRELGVVQYRHFLPARHFIGQGKAHFWWKTFAICNKELLFESLAVHFRLE